MKRFLSFLLFVLLLSVGVGALQVWKAHREGVSLRGPLGRFFDQGPAQRRPEKYTVADGPSIDLKDVDVLAAMSRQRVLLAKAVVPSVVSITTSRTVRRPRSDDPYMQFFHRGMGNTATQQTLGSGAIVSKEGHIVTNNHVIDQMDQIEVELSDGRTKKARLIGADAATDIAILKIDAGDLQPLPFGDSDKVEVGETVMAIGNPYGLEESVTQGIISAKGRANETLSDLFQTDSAINPGNSGGPLVNVRGEMIGINEAIYATRSGGWQGVGFAIPSATVRRTMDSILKTGRAVHGYLGVNLQPLTMEAAREFGLPDDQGAFVADVVPDSPAERAKIQRGDFIKKFNNQRIGDIQELRRRVSEAPVDTNVPVELLRGGKVLTLTAKIAEKPPEAQLSQIPQRQPPPQRQGRLRRAPGGNDDNNNGGNPAPPLDNVILGGLKAVELTPEIARSMGLPDDLQGVYVQCVEAYSPVASQMQRGDVIEQVNQQPITSLAELAAVLEPLPPRHPIVLSIVRNRARTLVVIRQN
jgi:serine protease Do